MITTAKKIGRLVNNLRWFTNPTTLMRSHRDAMAALKNKHKNTPALIIGNGPSLNAQDLTQISNFVSFAANSFFLKSQLTGVPPTYLTVEDPLPAEDNADSLIHFDQSLKIAPFDLRYVFGDEAGYTYVNFVRGYRPFVGPFFPLFSHHGEQAIFWGGTVVYMNLQLAAHMGCNPIYFTGMDLTYDIPESAMVDKGVITSTEDDPNHFDPVYFGAGKRWHLPHTDVMQHCLNYAYRKLTASGFRLYNLTEGGNLQGIPRRSFQKVVADLSPKE